MNKYLKYCNKCNIKFSTTDLCPKCGGEGVSTPCLVTVRQQLSAHIEPERLNHFFAWKYGGDEVKKDLSQKYTQEELEQIYICPRCGDLGSMKDSNHCFYCGAQMVPTHYKYEDILQRDMSKEEFEQWKKTLYGEYCYPNPLFDKEEFHRTKIRKGEEEDPDKKQEEQMKQILDAIRWAGSRNL